MRLSLPSTLTALSRLGDRVETTRSVLAAFGAFVDELYEIAEHRARGQHYERPDAVVLSVKARQIMADVDAYPVAVGGHVPYPRPGRHLTAVPDPTTASEE